MKETILEAFYVLIYRKYIYISRSWSDTETFLYCWIFSRGCPLSLKEQRQAPALRKCGQISQSMDASIERGAGQTRETDARMDWPLDGAKTVPISALSYYLYSSCPSLFFGLNWPLLKEGRSAEMPCYLFQAV